MTRFHPGGVFGRLRTFFRSLMVGEGVVSGWV